MSWFSPFPLSSTSSLPTSAPRRPSDDLRTSLNSQVEEEERRQQQQQQQQQHGEDALSVPSALDAHLDARAIVRLFQCHFCSLPVQQPVLLPCGNGLCRKCLPKSYKRENITYPSLPSRLEGFICPFEECRQEHALEDSSADVTLKKIMDRINVETVRRRMTSGDTPTQVVEKLHWRHLVGDPDKKAGYSRILHGGRLLASFTMAELGELRYDSDLSFESLSSNGDKFEALDHSLSVQIKEAIQNDMECQVCWSLMLDPLTTTCGHSFCRRCVARLLDHANVCPVCRKSLSIRPGAIDEPSNQRLFALLESFVPEIVLARTQIVEAEESVASETGRVPLFVCALSYPQMPTFLHVFEPRYRLMIRRAMSSDRKFGMVAYNARGEVQGDLGVTQFMKYGTLLHIESIQLLPDGRSVIQTRGVSRFRILDHDLLDDYSVGRTERIEDLPIASEEALEASEISQHNAAHQDGSTSVRPLSALSTAELMQYCADFIERMHCVSASWLASNVLQAYGDMPNDPAIFPYWFASVLPITETEKYRLLPTTSVRERLKITAGWVRKMQGMRYTIHKRMYDPLRTISDLGIEEILATIPTAFGSSSRTPSTASDSDDSDSDDSDDGDYVPTEPHVAPSDNELPSSQSEQNQ